MFFVDSSLIEPFGQQWAVQYPAPGNNPLETRLNFDGDAAGGVRIPDEKVIKCFYKVDPTLRHRIL